MRSSSRSRLAGAREPIGTGGYDVVVGDLLSTQLLFPALLDYLVHTIVARAH